MSTGDNDVFFVQGAWGTLAEQRDESYYDKRSDADDDLSKCRIEFPEEKLYGRGQKLKLLHKLYLDIASSGREGCSCPKSEIQQHSSGSTTDDRINSQLLLQNVKEGKQKYPSRKRKKNNSMERPSTHVVFLSGYSGIGKSTLVSEFIRTIKREEVAEESDFLLAIGKYSDLRSTSAPFSGFSDAFQKLMLELMRIYQSKDERGNEFCLFSEIRKRIRSSGIIAPGTEGNQMLQSTFHSLIPLVNQDMGNDPESQEPRPLLSNEQGLSPIFRMNVLTEAIRELIFIICCCVKLPLLLVLEDLQWVDEPSLDILTSLLSDKTLKNAFFMCSYRSNEVHPGDPFHKFREKIDDVRLSGVKTMSSVEHVELYNLAPDDISQFIADSLNREIDEVSSLAEVIYEKTIGNIFYVKQAIEQLLRKNVLYYDVMSFEWKWNVSRIELENFLAHDVVDMVKSKIKGLPREIQILLIVMTFIPRSIDTVTLRDLMCANGICISIPGMKNILEKSVLEAMLVASDCGEYYSFAHDRIREALFSMIPDGDRREELAVLISIVLLERGEIPQNEWMLFVAIDNLNSVSYHRTNDIDVAQLNLRVAKIAMKSGASTKANELLHSGLKNLELTGNKWVNYEFTLDLYNNFIRTEYTLGGFDHVGSAVQEVLSNAKTLNDKLNAYIFQIKCIGEGKNRNYALGAKEAVKTLELFDFKIPFSPSKVDLLNEKLRLASALRNRSLTFLAELPVAENYSLFHLFTLLGNYSLFSRNDALLKISAQRGIRLAIQKGICPYTSLIILNLAALYAKEGDVKTGYAFGTAAAKLSEVFRHDKENYALTRHILYGGVLTHLLPFRDGIEQLIPAHKDLKLAGSTDMALNAGLSYMNTYLISGLPLNSMFDQNLGVLEDYSKSVGVKSYTSLFQAMRQFVLNIRNQLKSPTEFKGEVFDEAQALESMDGNAKSMTLRDVTILRLVLAFIFCDYSTMEEMIVRLADYPLTDPMPSRMHLRLGFIGLTAFMLGKKRNNSLYLKIGQTSYDFFKKLSKDGSLSARPFYLLLEALKRPGVSRFNEAIASCAKSQILHLEAIANEHCGLFLEKKNMPELARTYITNSYMLYRQWGAYSKSKILLERHEFLTSDAQRQLSSKFVSFMKTRQSSIDSTRRGSDCNTLSLFEGVAHPN